ncbi:hypothetical protein M441DRAFT_405207 [Trichoderma asperellum CBS 433.97]|uniref:Uncharacterized protein n=1 Tax=Trichoderma asperellum (strain ATCC 204424 / CBS 433.97 / NBRC 101777) TaxID=1042311 RepID=A0A2T3ZAI1_TRIA4|nr:hypothetical protein M441DRAFT_405207 [Trichoderma asperellum CBS 433.97]PTB41821.1 hypothetical protein M441DRAFT_405207 [Trichoderma asperellum CBS 433.97]
MVSRCGCASWLPSLWSIGCGTRNRISMTYMHYAASSPGTAGQRFECFIESICYLCIQRAKKKSAVFCLQTQRLAMARGRKTEVAL